MSICTGQIAISSATLKYAGPSRGVLAYSGIEDPETGYSASPRFAEAAPSDNESARNMTLDAPGIMVGKPENGMLFPTGTIFMPITVLHNISPNPLTVNLLLTAEGPGSGPRTRALDRIVLASGETRQVDYKRNFSDDDSMPDG